MDTKLILDNYLGKNTRVSEKDKGDGYKEVCDLDTGDCYTLRIKDGLIERVDNKLNNGLNEIKTGLANLMFNSEKPIKNVSSLSVVSEKGTRLTIN